MIANFCSTKISHASENILIYSDKLHTHTDPSIQFKGRISFKSLYHRLSLFKCVCVCLIYHNYLLLASKRNQTHWNLCLIVGCFLKVIYHLQGLHLMILDMSFVKLFTIDNLSQANKKLFIIITQWIQATARDQFLTTYLPLNCCW